MLTIKNIDKVIGVEIFDRKLIKTEHHINATKESYYVFVFDWRGDGKDWNNYQYVHLSRSHNEGKYRLFVMGLQIATEIELKRIMIEKKPALIAHISQVLEKAEYWWNLKSKTN